jgi:acyl carrier protein
MTVLESARRRQGELLRHCLRFILSAGLSAAVRQGLEEVFGVPVLETYGLSEAGTVAANSVAPGHRKSGTMGKPWPNEVAIRADDGRLLLTGAAGEIVVRGPVLMPGYLDDEEANHVGFVQGWFRTGDIGSIDAEGFLTVLGRLKEFINRGGEKISPYEIERALLLHPCVREAAAFSVAHPRLGENVAAAVVLTPDANTTPREVKAFLSDHLAPFKIPQQVFVKAELPKGATGKTLRRQLSDEAAEHTRDVVPPATPLHCQILEIWQRLIGRDDIGIDDDFFEAGGDSLLATQMVCEVEAVTRQRILPSALRTVFTVRELAAAIVRGSPAMPELVTCAKQGYGTPFLFCHGDYTTRGFYALKFAEMLTCDQPVFLVHPFLDPDPKLTIEQMAQAYLPDILAAHPAGAFCLGGHCNGGLLAWEIARQLQLLGREVGLVVLVDAPSLNARPILRALGQLNKLIVAVAPKRMSKKFALNGMRAIWARGYWHVSLYGPYSRAICNYVPPKIATRVLCMISDENRAKIEYSWTPWTNLADGVHCEYIKGTHLSCITTHVSELTRVLDCLLSQP